MNEVLGKIGFDWHLAIINFVNIFIIFLVLKKWAFGPIGKIIEERRSRVEVSMRSAEDAKRASALAEKEREDILLGAKKEASSIIERASKEGEGILEHSRGKALHERDDILHKASLEIAEGKRKAEGELKSHAAELISASVKKILRSEVDNDMNERIIKKSKRINV